MIPGNRTPILDPFRTLKRSFYVICDKHLWSALILDYVVSVEHALDEARSQGERFGQWRALSADYLASVLVAEPSKNTVKAALRKLVALGFIEAHPSNATNLGGFAASHRNQYRLCTAQVLTALRQYHAGQNEPAEAEGLSIVTSMVVNSDQQRRSELTGYAGQNRPQESVEESVSESSSSSSAEQMRKRMMSLIEVEELWHTFAGRRPTEEQRTALLEMAGQYGADALAEAVCLAKANGARHYRYIRRILENPPASSAPPTPAPAPERTPYTAPEPEAPLTEEQRERLRAQLRALRSVQS